MSRSIIRNCILPVVFLLIVPDQLRAQAESTQQEKQKIRIIDKAVLQYAGGIGFVNAGVGRTFFKKNNGELDLLIGYVPKFVSEVEIWTVTLKYSHYVRKWAYKKEKLELYPLGLGMWVNQPFSKQYTKYSNRNQYPKGYYWFNNLPRMGWFWSGQLTYELKKDRALTFYSELGTYDLLLFSWSGNRETIPFYTLFNFSCGLKYRFR